MKKLIAVCALLAASSSFAEGVQVLGMTTNKAGGEVMIYNLPCKGSKVGNMLVATNEHGQVTSTGCAAPISNNKQIVVWWSDGELSIVPTSTFEWVQEK